MYLILCILFCSLFTFVSHFFIIFLSSTFKGETCVRCVQVATPLLPICLKRTRKICLSIRQTLIFRRAKLRQTRAQTYHELNPFRLDRLMKCSKPDPPEP